MFQFFCDIIITIIHLGLFMKHQKHVLQDLEFGDAGGGYTVISRPNNQSEPSLTLIGKAKNRILGLINRITDSIFR